MADVQPSTITGAFHRPFDEQVAFFRQKLGNLVPTRFWDDLKKAEHDRAFMVAGAAKAELLQDMAAAVERSISEGQSIEAFRTDFFALAKRHGWTNYTGSGTAGGRAWRTRVIYTTNAQTSYSAGRLAQLRAGNFTLWIYHHSDGELSPRPVHLSWDSLTLPPDHPFWRQHYPPSGWGCRCYVTGARNAEDAKLMGGNPDKPVPPGSDRIDPKTGEPPGIDKGWGYMPGDTVSNEVQALVEKPAHWDYTLAKTFMQDLPPDARDGFSTAYRNLPSVADDARRYVQRVLSPDTTADIPPYRTLGLATSTQVKQIAKVKKGLDVSGYDFALSPEGIQHVQSRHGVGQEKDPNQMPITALDFALLPRLLNAAGTAMSYIPKLDYMGIPGVKLVSTLDGETYTTVWGIRARRKMLALHSFRKKKP